eukprot:4886085-Alexandrium_andersonii.AAC.1
MPPAPALAWTRGAACSALLLSGARAWTAGAALCWLSSRKRPWSASLTWSAALRTAAAGLAR